MIVKLALLLVVNVCCGLHLVRLAMRGDAGDCARITHAGGCVLALILNTALGVML